MLRCRAISFCIGQAHFHDLSIISCICIAPYAYWIERIYQCTHNPSLIFQTTVFRYVCLSSVFGRCFSGLKSFCSPTCAKVIILISRPCAHSLRVTSRPSTADSAHSLGVTSRPSEVLLIQSPSPGCLRLHMVDVHVNTSCWQIYYPIVLSDWWMDDWISRVYPQVSLMLYMSGIPHAVHVYKTYWCV